MTEISRRGRMASASLLRALLVVALAAILACSVNLISSYDENIDTAATSLQRQMDAFLTEMQSTPPPAYQDCEEFYQQYQVDIRSVLVRAQSHPKNERTVKQLELMLENLAELQRSHKEDEMSPEMAIVMRDLFNQGWRAIITLEVAKKRGDG